MKIGILTFHWGANHGAVLQAYATQKYIENNFDSEVCVIDYYPKNQEISLKNAFKTKRVWLIPERIRAVGKNKRISAFRSGLNLTKRYYTNKQLKDNPPDCDVLISGSDQIWNPGFALWGEGKPTPVYFLNFGKESCKKVALSVSFGCTEYPQKVADIVKPYIRSFDAISVREKSGLTILNNMGVTDAVITADPTALLSSEQYLNFCTDSVTSKNNYTALCILRRQNKKTKMLISDLIKCYNNKIVDIEKMSVPNWLTSIRDAEVVITNSFHCVMMCLKLHTPFVVVTENGSLAGMNDRLFTLLDHFDLTECIVSDINQYNLNREFDWDIIDIHMEEYATTLKLYIDNIIGGKNE